ncbi:MAG TPA: flagellar protein FlaG [Bryobacteraceae bacterium]|nr:flagellar protein FlaG [Bryobacteraceae bacterium]
MDITPMHRPGSALSPAPAPVPAETAVENREIIQAVKALNAAELFGQNSELTFLLDRRTQRPVIRLVDRKTKDVIRQIPPEHVLRMARDLAHAE